MIKRALLSVSDKKGLVELAQQLIAADFELISSGGTASCLREAGLSVQLVEDVTAFPEILGGRVKTLHPKIHGALLAKYDDPEHVATLEQQGIPGLSLCVVNLYPFVRTVADASASIAQCVEQIDIGGPTLLRAAAKNFQHLTVVCDPDDYASVAQRLTSGFDLSFRVAMAQKAFQHVFDYDRHIADWMDTLEVSADGASLGTMVASTPLPLRLRSSYERVQTLRYGENPHQQAAVYRQSGQGEVYHQLQGKELSFNNLVDMESALRVCLDFSLPTAVIVKHTNPCGIACHVNLKEAFIRARAVDPVSAFGGVLAFNREVDGPTAREITQQFSEVIIAPAYTEEALSLFRKKKNIRVMTVDLSSISFEGLEFRLNANGLLVQESDHLRLAFEGWQLRSKRSPNAEQIQALTLAWKAVVHVKSNAIVYADASGLVGVGAGQMSRVDSAKIALWKAQEAGLSIRGAVMASDAFFPFRDSIDAAAAAGISAIVEPGGSVRDEEVISAADEHGMVLYFTGVRHFKH
jgi:phosphoribosylaminoimidazolecarboxamide formyltransferase/IMP cyclohydrolase